MKGTQRAQRVIDQIKGINNFLAKQIDLEESIRNPKSAIEYYIANIHRIQKEVEQEADSTSKEAKIKAKERYDRRLKEAGTTFDTATKTINEVLPSLSASEAQFIKDNVSFTEFKNALIAGNITELANNNFTLKIEDNQLQMVSKEEIITIEPVQNEPETTQTQPSLDKGKEREEVAKIERSYDLAQQVVDIIKEVSTIVKDHGALTKENLLRHIAKLEKKREQEQKTHRETLLDIENEVDSAARKENTSFTTNTLTTISAEIRKRADELIASLTNELKKSERKIEVIKNRLSVANDLDLKLKNIHDTISQLDLLDGKYIADKITTEEFKAISENIGDKIFANQSFELTIDSTSNKVVAIERSLELQSSTSEAFEKKHIKIEENKEPEVTPREGNTTNTAVTRLRSQVLATVGQPSGSNAKLDNNTSHPMHFTPQALQAQKQQLVSTAMPAQASTGNACLTICLTITAAVLAMLIAYLQFNKNISSLER